MMDPQFPSYPTDDALGLRWIGQHVRRYPRSLLPQF